MAFNQRNFAPVGPQASLPPKLYSYVSDDNVAAVTAVGYFADKRHQFELGDWIIARLADGNALFQVLADTSTVVQTSLNELPLDNLAGGFFDYNDLATATTPIAVTGGAGFTKLTNDQLGAFTNKAYPPLGVTDLWNSTTNQFTFTQLKLGDMVDIRVDLEITTASPNTVVELGIFLGIGGSQYQIDFANPYVKSVGLWKINDYNGIYMGDTNTLNNPAELRIQADGNITVKVNGWFVKVIKRG